MDRQCPYCLADLSKNPTKQWVLPIPIDFPSGNDLRGNKGPLSARRMYRRFRDQSLLLLKNMKNTLRIPDATHKRRVVIIREYRTNGPRKGRGQPRDRINNAHGHKPLLDAMILARLLVDDCEEYCDDYYQQRPVEGESCTVVVLEEI